jgi:hypothetical protein
VPTRLLVAAILLIACSGAAAQAQSRDVVCPAAPEGWSIKQARGPDFDVCYFTQPEQKGFFGIYFGYYPQFQPPANARGSPGIVAGMPVQWLKKASEAKGFPIAMETVFFPYAGNEFALRFKAHVWVYARTQQELPHVLKTVAELQFRTLGSWSLNMPAKPDGKAARRAPAAPDH